jgi:hypothetical protein
VKHLKYLTALPLLVALIACEAVVNAPLANVEPTPIPDAPVTEGAAVYRASSEAGEAGYCYWDGWMETATGEWVPCTYVEPAPPPLPHVTLLSVSPSRVTEGDTVTLRLSVSHNDHGNLFGVVYVRDSHPTGTLNMPRAYRWHPEGITDDATYYFLGGMATTVTVTYTVPDYGRHYSAERGRKLEFWVADNPGWLTASGKAVVQVSSR